MVASLIVDSFLSTTRRPTGAERVEWMDEEEDGEGGEGRGLLPTIFVGGLLVVSVSFSGPKPIC